MRMKSSLGQKRPSCEVRHFGIKGKQVEKGFSIKTGRERVEIRKRTGNNSSTTLLRVWNSTGRVDRGRIAIVVEFHRGKFITAHSPLVREGNCAKNNLSDLNK